MPHFLRKKWVGWCGVAVIITILVGFTQIETSSFPKAITSHCSDAADQQQQYCYGYRLLYGSGRALEGTLKELNTTFTLLGSIALVVFTALLFWSTSTLGNISSAQDEHFRITERAYVKMSHDPPGINFNRETGWYSIRLKITNFGRTPAEVLDAHVIGVVTDMGARLPAEPDYRRAEGMQLPVTAFLVADEHFYYQRDDANSVSAENAERIREGSAQLHVIGFVDYRDKFGEVHRAGYGRTYLPVIDRRDPASSNSEFEARNNLGFIIQAGYNYDRLRRPGEGWEQNAA